jgi:hypothetical protein
MTNRTPEMPARPHCVEFRAYPPDLIVSHVEREARVGAVDRSRLEADLLDALYDSGLAQDGSEQMAWFAEAMALQPAPGKLALGFRAMASAPKPLDPAVCTEGLHPMLSAAISQGLPARRPEPGSTRSILNMLVWDDLSDVERKVIRSIARKLEILALQRAPRHRPRMHSINALLNRLAEIFIAHSGFPYHADELPASAGSAFVQFAAAAIGGFYAGRHHMSPDQIARRVQDNRTKGADRKNRRKKPG